MPTTQQNNTQATQEQTPAIASPEVMHYVDTRWLFGIMIIIMIEMATPFGILFPTDAIVFWWGMYFSAKWGVPWGIRTIMALFSLAVILGDLLWYWWGTLLAPKIHTRQDNMFFKKKYITMCEKYFEEYGNKTMIVSKFLPIRSMIPLVAGALLKPFGSYLIQSIVSAILWIWSLLGASYLIIWLIPSSINHIGLLTFLFVVIPQVISFWYVLRPMIKKYEARLTKASANFQHIVEEVSAIWSQFAAIWHEVKEIVTKVVQDDQVVVASEVAVPPTEPVSSATSSPVIDNWSQAVSSAVPETLPVTQEVVPVIPEQLPIPTTPVVEEIKPEVVQPVPPQQGEQTPSV